jgi:SseB protein N-terminal domain
MPDHMTPLDLAFAAMQADEADDVARLRYYGELANADLCLLLDKQAGATSLTPKVYDLENGPFVLVFEGEERLAGFVGTVAPCAHLAGRVIAGLLAGKGIGLAINLQGASSLLIPADAVDWLDGVLTQTPDVVDAVPEAIAAPGDLPADLLQALGTNLALAAGQADAAYLAAVTYQTGRRGHILVFAGAKVRAEAALVRATGEALVFSGLDAGEVDVAFLAAGDAMVAALSRVALRFDMGVPEVEPVAAAAPGSDPARPPKLR